MKSWDIGRIIHIPCQAISNSSWISNTKRYWSLLSIPCNGKLILKHEQDACYLTNADIVLHLSSAIFWIFPYYQNALGIYSWDIGRIIHEYQMQSDITASWISISKQNSWLLIISYIDSSIIIEEWWLTCAGLNNYWSYLFACGQLSSKYFRNTKLILMRCWSNSSLMTNAKPD